MTTSNPLIARFANEPSLLAPGTEDRFRALLNAAASHPMLAELDSMERAEGGDFWNELGPRASAILRPYIVQNGILLIPVRGVLLNDFPYAFYDLATGYEYITEAFKRGMDDSNVKGIALVIDSPGGMVAGCFGCVDKMYARRGEKPVRAYASESAYSAAYAIFSVAEHGTVARTGGVGSIGVVTAHMDLSKALEDFGIKITFIFAGKHKVDGNAYEPLPADVKARIQTRIDELYGIFVQTVARNRGLDEQAVRDTEALTFTASESLSNGLADEIGELDDALAAFAADLSNPQGDEEMSTQDSSAGSNQAAIDQAVAAANATAATEREAAVATARTEAVTAERTRIAAILGSDEAKGREGLASHLALETDTAAEAAVAILAKSPKVEEGAETPFDKEMSRDNPDVGSGDGGDDKPSDPVGLARAAGIRGVRPAPVPAQ
jgi:signal peptide peptidase SppA